MKAAALALGAAAVLAVAACKESTEERVDRLIEKLGSESRETRMDALAELRRVIAVPLPTEEENKAFVSGPMVMGPRELTELQLRGAAAVDRLVGDEPDRGIRMEAALILSYLRPPGHRPGLLECAFHGDHFVAGSCVEALLYVSDPANLQELVGLLRRRDSSLDPREPYDPGRSKLVTSLTRTGPHLLPHLVPLIDEGDPNAIESIVYPLAEIATDESCALVARIAMNPRAPTSERVLALYYLGSPPAGRDYHDAGSETLCRRAAKHRQQIEALRADSDLSVRCQAACILGERLDGCETECSPSPPLPDARATGSTHAE